ncbi:hypothetical protein XU18_3119 [Perkinsela sp. CCAP 1560/4]|nr:hypothetical protein XU18_3119 [Perkinsela sp. CCAP 1560/4]|eukprot:KNH05957.1 hypothetical protein XU18_3119 [Perkinsela sp. CCAP 1560/4]
MRFELFFLDAVDPSLGRLDYASLSQQALMEMVIDGITNKEKICRDPDAPKEIEEWKGVVIEDGKVAEIDWDEFDLKGSLHLEWLPSSLRWNPSTVLGLRHSTVATTHRSIGRPFLKRCIYFPCRVTRSSVLSTSSRYQLIYGTFSLEATSLLLTRWKITSSLWVGSVPIHGEVQETAVSCHGGSRILLVARRENVHSFSMD